MPDPDPPRPSRPSNPTSPTAEALFESTASESLRAGARIPTATYRLQLNREFTFRDALAQVPYLHALGISDLYVSPFFRARPGSMHGYDIVDHSEFDPAIGTRADFDALTDALAARGMGLVLDIVPNHMGIATGDNAWWMDVLENGPGALHAAFFDIDWSPLKPELKNKVLLPVLGDHYGRVLESGEIKLAHDDGGFTLRVYDKTLPIDPSTIPVILAPVLVQLIDRLGDEHDVVLELQSIVTGLVHLPAATERQRSRAIERRRESQILRRRMASLLAASTDVRGAIEDAVARINGTPGDPRSFDLLEALLERQSYRLSFWRVAAEEVNYRRFFDINDLAAIRMEHAPVFAEANRLVSRLLYEGRITGLRVDHPDGLWDPTLYFAALQRSHFVEQCRRAHAAANPAADPVSFERIRGELAQLWSASVANDPRSALSRPLYIVVEKILARGERLPADWKVHGTSGYDFAALLNGIMVDASSERALTEIYQRFAGDHDRFDALVYQSKKLILRTSLASELNVLANALGHLAERDRYSRDFTLGALRDALREVIACFPVYRTYVSARTLVPDDHDRTAIERAIRLARRRNPTTDASLFTFLRSVLMLEPPARIPVADRDAWREFVMRVQQLTSPVMAKGVEDTAFYVYNRLVSLNEVGGEPERFGQPLASFHREIAERGQLWPGTMNATSTHDTKRSEDARARIAVLSELPDVWSETLARCGEIAAGFKTEIDGRVAPDRNEEYLLYQSILGTYPFDAPRGDASTAYADRLVAYMRKATKEAKVNTSWMDADPEYDAAVESFVRRVLSERSEALEALGPLQSIVSHHGMWSALSQVVLRCTCPGVPDTYQGSEWWDFSLVDPDNRRRVDFARGVDALAKLSTRMPDAAALARDLVQHANDGRIKQYVLLRALHERRERPEIFSSAGAYVPLTVSGPAADHVVAFARRSEHGEALVVAPRWSARLAKGALVPPTGACWRGTRVGVEHGDFEHVFTGARVRAEPQGDATALALAEVLAEFPVAILRRLTRR